MSRHGGAVRILSSVEISNGKGMLEVSWLAVKLMYQPLSHRMQVTGNGLLDGIHPIFGLFFYKQACDSKKKRTESESWRSLYEVTAAGSRLQADASREITSYKTKEEAWKCDREEVVNHFQFNLLMPGGYIPRLEIMNRENRFISSSMSSHKKR